jgi:LmbE family N-acetylglucosaminyl deacetylase
MHPNIIQSPKGTHPTDTLSVKGLNPEISNDKPSIAAIIPAYNEACHLGNILTVLQSVSYLSEIIVVDDGSSDGTYDAAIYASKNDPRLHLLRHDINLGKGQAIFTGAQATQADYLLLLDADLVGFTKVHIEKMVSPLIKGQAEMTVGLFQGGRLITDIAHRATPWLSGQRCIKAELIRHISKEAAHGYGFETAITITSRQCNWRCKDVRLFGVSRMPARIRNSFREVAKRRVRMYGDISRTMRVTGGWRYLAPRTRPVIRVLLALLLLLFGSSLVYNRSRAASSLQISELPVLDLTTTKRVLVVSPHPDDETLGAGGLIQTALAEGARVKVLVITNGDGQVYQPLTFERRIKTGLRDFVGYGEHRQVETLDALKELGISAEDVLFLGYPDRSLLSLWLGNWEYDCPIQAIFTRVSNNPYKNSYNPLSRYCGSDLLLDIQSIIEEYLPDLIVSPHPNDDHPDHRAAANFTRLALALVQSENLDYRASVIGYLIHYGHFPQPRGSYLARPLLPPPPLSGEHNQWFRLDLSEPTLQQKVEAIKKYPTQIRLLGRFLPSFARPNEIFMNLGSVEVLPLDHTTFFLNETTNPEIDLAYIPIEREALLAEPSNESTSRYLLAGADLVGWRITRVGDQLILTANARGKLIPGLKYRIMVKTPDGRTYNFWHTGEGQFIAPRSFSARIDLSELEDPGVLAFAADVQQRITFERTGWYFIEVKDW